MARMTQQELMEKFETLYDQMAASRDTRNMMLFGSVMKNMMHRMIEMHPDAAMQYVETLEAINWHNYLTESEADGITSKMDPKTGWTFPAWKSVMDRLGLATNEEPFYNDYALYVDMSRNFSDHGQSLRDLFGIAKGDETNNEQFMKFVYKMSVDDLKDRDGMFDIRRYFRL